MTLAWPGLSLLILSTDVVSKLDNRSLTDIVHRRRRSPPPASVSSPTYVRVRSMDYMYVRLFMRVHTSMCTYYMHSTTPYCVCIIYTEYYTEYVMLLHVIADTTR